MSDDLLVGRAARALRGLLPDLPRGVIVLGSGLGDLDLGPSACDVSYLKIPGFPRARVSGHPGRLSLVGRTAVLRGRAHYYEGHTMDEVVRPIRVMAALGATAVVLTNAAGALHRSLRPGDLMVVRDHLNLMGENPLRGGARFLDLTRVYDTKGLRGLRTGVYAAMPGPTYETPAEVRMLRRLGADAVGMSTVPEAIAAREAGLRVIAISVITNLAAGLTPRALSHAEVLRTAAQARKKLVPLLGRLRREWET
jgi:purine-nucleoside phosphorylase